MVYRSKMSTVSRRSQNENIGKDLSNKYGQRLFDNTNKSTTDAIKTASKRATQKAAKATGDLIGNKIADKNQVFQNLQKNVIQMNCI